MCPPAPPFHLPHLLNPKFLVPIGGGGEVVVGEEVEEEEAVVGMVGGGVARGEHDVARAAGDGGVGVGEVNGGVCDGAGAVFCGPR